MLNRSIVFVLRLAELVVFGAFCAAKVTAQQSTGSVSGLVQVKGAPAIGAEVVLTCADSAHLRTKTDSSGGFYFEAVPAGAATVTASYLSWHSKRQVVVVSGQLVNAGVFNLGMEKKNDADRKTEIHVAYKKVDNTSDDPRKLEEISELGGGAADLGAKTKHETVELRGKLSVRKPKPKPAIPAPRNRKAYPRAMFSQSGSIQRAVELYKPLRTADLKVAKNHKDRATSEPVPYRSTSESYDTLVENVFKPVAEGAFSTFSIDVDGAAYANIRRMLNDGRIPPENAVRLEEMVNYFDYPTYAKPRNNKPFSIISEVGECPWNTERRLLRVALKGKDVALGDIPPLNLVFLIDVSGSMNSPNKLPLVKESLRMLIARLRPQDKVAIAVYAGAAGLVLPPTPGSDRKKILDALNKLKSGGSTAGGAGIQLAYKTLRDNFVAGGVNRVIIATDGDFNVGVNNPNDLVKLIEKERDADLYLTVLGFGQGNYRDDMTERLSNAGNGYAAYIDSKAESKKVLVDEFSASMLTIANDVKLQLEFNEEVVKSYRLIGYENRLLNFEDFKDDKVDAGDVGAGHTVTALYELVPSGSATAGFRPTVTVNLRYKTPGDSVSKPLTYDVIDRGARWDELDADFRFAASVASFGMLLRGSKFSGAATLTDVKSWALNASANDPEGRRKEFLTLVDKFEVLQKRREAEETQAQEKDEGF